MDFTHFNDEGHAKMVNVGGKEITQRKASASGKIYVNSETFRLIKTGGMKKGDVLTTAQIAGIMGAKRTPDIIPMCHNINLNGADISFILDEENFTVEVKAEISCSGRTGVEMEALTAVSIALLTIYDMCKAVQKDMIITDIHLISKSGGVHGDYEAGSSINNQR
ncbi:MAG: cyclic pyranopterin monophosphate synthase MoaC [Synergistaceae bacterium]|nr:cyclic pyranopterin monophosphate synthase MoaC [Synergistaceae bacterium]